MKDTCSRASRKSPFLFVNSSNDNQYDLSKVELMVAATMKTLLKRKPTSVLYTLSSEKRDRIDFEEENGALSTWQIFWS